MYYLFHGTDGSGVRVKAKEFLARQEQTGELHVLTGNDLLAGALGEALSATSFFESTQTFQIEVESDDVRSLLTESLPLIASSQNIFVILEGKLTAGILRTFEAYAHEVVSVDLKSENEFNIFALTDALRERDKKQLWILLQEAWKSGKTSEEIIGTLFWQLKVLALARMTTGAASGLKPFVYDKAKRALLKWGTEDEKRITHALVLLYHEGHTGKRTIDSALEAWVLSL